MNTIKTKRPRVKVINKTLVKDKTINLLAEMCNVTYNKAFDAYLWADDIVKQFPNEDRLLHARNRLQVLNRKQLA